MTFISFVFHPEYVSVVSDGRSSLNGEILDEDVIKQRELGNRIIVAAGGNTQASQKTLDYAAEYFNSTGEDIAGMIEHLTHTIEQRSLDDRRIGLMIAGFNKQNDLLCSFLEIGDEFSSVPFKVEKPLFIPIVSAADRNKEVIKQADLDFLSLDKSNLNKVIEFQSQLNDRIAIDDKTVNENKTITITYRHS